MLEAEHFVHIAKSDAIGELPKTLRYDFGKASPTPVEFIGCIISIMAHYFPTAQISEEAYGYVDEFYQGVHLAKHINSEVKNPLAENTDTELPEMDADIALVLQALENPVQQNNESEQEQTQKSISKKRKKQTLPNTNKKCRLDDQEKYTHTGPRLYKEKPPTTSQDEESSKSSNIPSYNT
jgi:hypothetical protein